MKNIKIILIILFCLSAGLNIFAQKSIYIEAVGQGVAYTIGYDVVRNTSNPKVFKNWNIGVTVLPLQNYNFYGLNTAWGVLLGDKSLKLELGTGITFSYLMSKLGGNFKYELSDMSTTLMGPYPASVNNNYQSLAATFRIGVRYQKEGSNIFLKAAFTPLLSVVNIKNEWHIYTQNSDLVELQIFKGFLNSDNVFLPLFGIGIGYTIK